MSGVRFVTGVEAETMLEKALAVFPGSATSAFARIGQSFRAFPKEQWVLRQGIEEMMGTPVGHPIPMNCRLPLFVFLTFPLASAHAAVNWSFDYTGSTEFDTSAVGMARRAALEAAGTIAGSFFQHTATVTVAVSSTNEAGSSTLASAGSNFPNGFTAGFGSSGYVRERILGRAGNPAGADGTVNVNFTHNWDLDDDIAADAFDFKSTMIHELLHATGFSSDINEDGSDTFSNAAGTPAMWTLFDSFLTDAAGNPIIDRSTFALSGAVWTRVSAGGGGEGNVLADGIYFSGPRAMAANDGLPVRIFSPNPWQPGSSGSHLDDLFYEGNVMMKAATTEGAGARNLTVYEKGMLEDLGYTLEGAVTPPSPSGLAAWKAGFFGGAGALTGNGEDFDGDGKSNLLEYAMGTNPAMADSGPGGLQYTGSFAGAGAVTKTGQPIIRMEAGETRALYVRRKDRGANGLTYMQRFSGDLATWQNSNRDATVLADDGTVEVVSVPFPKAGRDMMFFRLEVQITP